MANSGTVQNQISTDLVTIIFYKKLSQIYTITYSTPSMRSRRFGSLKDFKMRHLVVVGAAFVVSFPQIVLKNVAQPLS